MSQIYLSADADLLADRLLSEIEARREIADPFEPISIVVPNRFVQQWLKFRIARAWNVAINLQFTFLEQALWDWLREIDPRPHSQPPQLLDGECYQLLVLSILWNDVDPALTAVQDYFEQGVSSRLTCRRAWQMAGRLTSLIREYEYHRQDSIIQLWHDPDGEVEVPRNWREREAAQRAIFRRVSDAATGRLSILNRRLGRNLKTLPQYAMEFIHDVRGYRTPPRRAVHVFGVSQMSPLHVRALNILSEFHDLRIYHANPLAPRIDRPTLESLRELAARFRSETRADQRPGSHLLQTWGRAGVESLHLAADFLGDPANRATLLTQRRGSESPRKRLSRRAVSPQQPSLFPQWDEPDDAGLIPETVLSRLQTMIRDGAPCTEPLPQDESLQIASCPGIWREAEAIHAGIVQILDQNPQLQQTDIAIFVTDMDQYRPVLMSAFERPPRRLSYAMADYSAARVSTYGQAVVGMLDLSLENLSRSRVFEVLLNPCVLAKFKIDREDALHWLTWAERLGIYHSWDAAEKRDLGYVGSPYFSWKLGLQRLRMGQYMDVVADDRSGVAPRWGDVIPFADVESGDRERLDQFCRLVEGLLPMLVRLRGMKATAGEWSETLLVLLQRFLAVPDDRPEEEPVRDSLIESMGRFAEWDLLQDAEVSLPLALVREAIAGRLRDIPGRRNDVLASGVTIASLQPQRPIPFEVVFLAGLGEKNFPGSASPSPFDLRQIRRQDGDILAVEQQRQGFLDAILAAKKKLVITYNGRDLQRDEALQPSMPVAQLQRFVTANIAPDFHVLDLPLSAHDPVYLEPATIPSDLLTHDHVADRIIALESAVESGRVVLDGDQQELVQSARRRLIADFASSQTAITEHRPIPTVAISKLKKFLENPAASALKYHLRADDEWDDQREEDFEPLTSPKYLGRRIIQQTLERIVERAHGESAKELAESWPEEFGRRYREATLRGQLPEGSFGTVDAAGLKSKVEETLTAGGLLEFIEEQASKTFCGPLLIGESETPLGARRRLPALTVPLSRPLGCYPDNQARIIGSWPFVWMDDASLDLLVFSWNKFEPKHPLSRAIFESLLFVLSLTAAGEARGRSVNLNILDPGGVTPLALQDIAVDARHAHDYLRDLATDFLDVECADQLPFDQIGREYAGVYRNDDYHPAAVALLDSWRLKEADEDWGFNGDRLNSLTARGFRVPDDAASKLRRRFRPLYAMLPPYEAKPRKRRTKGGES